MTRYMPTPNDRALATPLDVDTLDVVCTTHYGDQPEGHTPSFAVEDVMRDEFRAWLGDGRPDDGRQLTVEPDAEGRACIQRAQCPACVEADVPGPYA